MATVFNPFAPKKDDEEDQRAPPPSSGGEAATTATPTAASAAPGPSSSGRFTNLQKFIGANKDFNQAQGGLAGQIAGGIAGAGQKATSNIAGAQKTFGEQGAAAVGKVTVGKPIVKAAVDDPTKLTPDDLAKLKTGVSGVYGGPKSLSDLQGDQNLGNLQVGVQNVKNLSKQTRSEPGRFNLLRSMFDKSGYSSGQQKLDQLLLQGQPEQQARLSATRRTALGAEKALGSAQEAATTQGKQFTSDVDKSRESTISALSGAVGTKKADIETRLASAQASADAEEAGLQSRLAAGTLTPDDLNKMGVTSGTQIFDVDPSKFIKKSSATAQSFATPEDYAYFKALQDILGAGETPEAAGAVFGEFADPRQAGTAAPSVSYDVAGLQGAAAGRKAEFETATKDINQGLQETADALTGDLYVPGGLVKAYDQASAAARSRAMTAPGITEDAVASLVANDPAVKQLRDQISWEQAKKAGLEQQYSRIADMFKTSRKLQTAPTSSTGTSGSITRDTRGLI